MASNVVAIKKTLASVPLTTLPFRGGWEFFNVATLDEQRLLVDASEAMLASAREAAIEGSADQGAEGDSSGSESD